ncbi:MAG: hypothetical protein ACYDCN_14750 [Bacteroidia bacterium]
MEIAVITKYCFIFANLKTRYTILIIHLLLYPIAYFIVSIYNYSPSPMEISKAIEQILDITTQFFISLVVLTLIPIIGLLVGLLKNDKEVKIGFLISTINAIIIFLLFFIIK